MRTAKESFLLTGMAADWKKVASHESFEPACIHAMMQLASEMAATTHPSLPTDPYVAIDANGQMHGAARVLEILHTLAEPVTQSAPTKRESLHY